MLVAVGKNDDLSAIVMGYQEQSMPPMQRTRFGEWFLWNFDGVELGEDFILVTDPEKAVALAKEAFLAWENLEPSCTHNRIDSEANNNESAVANSVASLLGDLDATQGISVAMSEVELWLDEQTKEKRDEPNEVASREELENAKYAIFKPIFAEALAASDAPSRKRQVALFLETLRTKRYTLDQISYLEPYLVRFINETDGDSESTDSTPLAADFDFETTA